MWRVSDSGFAHLDNLGDKEKDLKIYGTVFKRFQMLYEITDSVLQCIRQPMGSMCDSAVDR